MLNYQRVWCANDLVTLSGTKDNFSGGREKKVYLDCNIGQWTVVIFFELWGVRMLKVEIQRKWRYVHDKMMV